MLALTPEERLPRVPEFVESAIEIRELNGWTRSTATTSAGCGRASRTSPVPATSS